MSRQIQTIGIVGGLGPESTIEHYRQIIARYREQISDGSYPPIIIHSMDVRELFRQCGANEFGKVRDSIVESIQSLARAGAQFGLIASNTPHIVFDDKSLEQIVKANRQLLEKDFPLTYYSRQLLFSDRARESWVEPDLKHFLKDVF
jgi:hypothetical protein